MKSRNIVNIIFLTILLIYYYYTTARITLLDNLLVVLSFVIYIGSHHFIYDYFNDKSMKEPFKFFILIMEFFFILSLDIKDKVVMMPLFFIVLISSWLTYLIIMVMMDVDKDFKIMFKDSFKFSLDIMLVLLISLLLYYALKFIPNFYIGFIDILLMSILYYILMYRILKVQINKLAR